MAFETTVEAMKKISIERNWCRLYLKIDDKEYVVDCQSGGTARKAAQQLEELLVSIGAEVHNKGESMKIRLNDNCTEVENLFPGDSCIYKGQAYMVLSSKRVTLDGRVAVPLANLKKGTIRFLPDHVKVEFKPFQVNEDLSRFEDNWDNFTLACSAPDDSTAI